MTASYQTGTGPASARCCCRLPFCPPWCPQSGGRTRARPAGTPIRPVRPL